MLACYLLRPHRSRNAQDLTITLQIEFPSILLPPDIHSGSIVDVNVSRNFEAESQSTKSFHALQSEILSSFGSASPSTPVLRCRNATQTSVVLEWDPISLATADLRNITLYRNGNKAGAIPRPFENTSTKISGLAVDTEYTFSLILRTSAGTYSSESLRVRTHKMTDLSGITVTPGVIPPQIRESLESSIAHMGAKLIDNVRIDTTHFVCSEEQGSAFEKAREMNIPVVVPDWVKGCEREGRIVGVRGYYLNADPKLRQVGAGAGIQSPQPSEASPRPEAFASNQQQSGTRPTETPRTEITPPTPDRPRQEVLQDEEEDGEEQEEEEEEEEDDDDEDEDEQNAKASSPRQNGDITAQAIGQEISASEDEGKSSAEANRKGSSDEETESAPAQTLSSRPANKGRPKTIDEDSSPEISGGNEEGNFDEVKL